MEVCRSPKSETPNAEITHPTGRVGGRVTSSVPLVLYLCGGGVRAWLVVTAVEW